MARAIWTGSIGFGMVHIPVALYTAASEKEVRFSRWHEATNSKPRQVQLCGPDNIETPLSEMVKAYEVSKGHHVIVKEEDLTAIEPDHSRHMPVIEFIDRSTVDPLHIEKSYFLGFDKLGQQAYALFVEAMKLEGRAAIVKCFMKTKEHLAMIWVNGDDLCLSTLYYEDEIVRANADAGRFGEKLPEVGEAEVAMARQLITMEPASAFDASKYKDEHRARIIAMIEEKVAGNSPVAKPTLVPSASPRNLLEELTESLKTKKAA